MTSISANEIAPFPFPLRISWEEIDHYTLFYKQRFFSTQPRCCSIFLWIEFQMLLRFCLIHKSIVILRLFLYLLYLCPCLDQSLYMSHLCDLFFIFIFISIKVTFNLINTDIHVFCLFFRIRICPIIFGW